MRLCSLLLSSLLTGSLLLLSGTLRGSFRILFSLALGLGNIQIFNATPVGIVLQ